MKNKMLACLLIAALAIGLCGCQLALPDGEEAVRDRLIGCFITTEYIDLFDFEAYFNENAHKLTSGENVISANDTEEYTGRLYAELYEEAFTDSEGMEHSTWNYRFPDLEGIAYFAPTIYEGEDDQYVTFQTGEGLNEVNNHLKSHNEDSYFTELSATVYAPVDSEAEFTDTEICFYMNPVYQSPDGTVYLMSGSGTAMNSVSAGIIMSTKLNEEHKTTIDGREVVRGGSVEISFATAYVPSIVRVIEMDAEGNVVDSSEFKPDALPESYSPSAETAYIISESITTDAAGEEIAERSIVEPEGENKNISVLVPSESGWLVSDFCEVLWE